MDVIIISLLGVAAVYQLAMLGGVNGVMLNEQSTPSSTYSFHTSPRVATDGPSQPPAHPSKTHIYQLIIFHFPPVLGEKWTS